MYSKKILTCGMLVIGLLAPVASTTANALTADSGSAAVAVSTTSSTDLSNGQGGSYTDRTFINYTAEGKTGQYHIYASGIDTSKPVGVVFQFHGDGGYEFKNPSYKLPGLNKEAKSQNMIFVSMKAPNTQNVWWNDIENNGNYARSLIQNEILGKYNIDKSRTWLVGYSGGAEFISYEMMQEQSDLFTGGGAIMFGGGGNPGSFERQPTQNIKDNFHAIWHTGLDDDLGNSDPGWSAIDTARKGSAFYKNSGFQKVELQTPAGIDHFEYDEPKIFGAELAEWAATHPMTATTTPAPAPSPTTDPLTPVESPAEAPAEEVSTSPEVVSSKVTYTNTGATITAKVDNAEGKLLTFRTSAYAMAGQTGYYEQAYVDANGEVNMSIESFTHTDARYWQLEDGGSYYTHGTVLAGGSVSQSDPVDESPAPAPAPTEEPAPAPAPTEEPAPAPAPTEEPAPAPTTDPLTPIESPTEAPAEETPAPVEEDTSTVLDSRVKSQKVTFTDNGAIIEAKIDGLRKGTKVLFRASASDLQGQTGFYEYGYVDRHGNVKVEISDFNHQDKRYWQLELGGGYSYYGKVLVEGTVSR